MKVTQVSAELRLIWLGADAAHQAALTVASLLSNMGAHFEAPVLTRTPEVV